MPEYFIPNAVR